MAVEVGLQKARPSNLTSDVRHNVNSSPERNTQTQRKGTSHGGRDWSEDCTMRSKEGKQKNEADGETYSGRAEERLKSKLEQHEEGGSSISGKRTKSTRGTSLSEEKKIK